MKKRRRKRGWAEKGFEEVRSWLILTHINRHSALHSGRTCPKRGDCSVAYIANIHPPPRSLPSAPFASLCTDIIGMKLNLYHVEYLTSHRSERLSINWQRSSAVLIDNPRAECIESGCGEWRELRGRLGCERVRVFGSDGPVSASTYNILCWSISATPFSLSVRLATFRRGGGGERDGRAPSPEKRGKVVATDRCSRLSNIYVVLPSIHSLMINCCGVKKRGRGEKSGKG